MRIIITICSLFIMGYSYSQTGFQKENGDSPSCQLKVKAPMLNGSGGKASGLIIKTLPGDSSKQSIHLGWRCTRTLSGDIFPLLVMDGILTKLDTLNSINPKDIKSVEILRNAVATAIYGYRASNGVIIITTKDSKIRKFIIKDALDGNPVAGATVMFMAIGRMDISMAVADSSGIVLLENIDPDVNYIMKVSAVGHQTYEEVFEKNYSVKSKEILLAREVITCPEVIITQTQCWKTLHCGYRVTVTRSREVAEAKQKATSFTIFPNPISKGGTLNIKFKTTDNEMKSIRVLSPEGRVLSTIPVHTDKTGDGFQIQTDTRWSAGIYFVQLSYENGRITASQKVIIQ